MRQPQHIWNLANAITRKKHFLTILFQKIVLTTGAQVTAKNYYMEGLDYRQFSKDHNSKDEVLENMCYSVVIL